MKKTHSLILLSGGLDSATAAAVALKESSICSAITFNYGQRHQVEVEAARRLSVFFRIEEHYIIDLPVDLFRNTALSPTSGIDVPKKRNMAVGAIPDTYVPARNILFLAYALAFAEPRNIRYIYIGVNSLDYSGYPDCRPEFIAAFERVANLATRSGAEGKAFSIQAPLIALRKWEIIRLGVELAVDYSLTHSCYDPVEGGIACGECDSCRIRKKGFEEAGITDPIAYAI